MKFGLVALSSLLILASSNNNDLIGYANQKTRQELSQKINNNVQNKLSDTFGGDQGTQSADKKYTNVSSTSLITTPKPTPAKTVFPTIQNTPVSTNVQNVSSDKGNSIITISPVTTAAKSSFVQATPAPSFSSLQSIKMAASEVKTRNQVDQKPAEQKILINTQPQIIQSIQAQQIPVPTTLALPQIIPNQNNLRNENQVSANVLSQTSHNQDNSNTSSANLELEQVQPWNSQMQNQNIPEYQGELHQQPEIQVTATNPAQQTQSYATATPIQQPILGLNSGIVSNDQVTAPQVFGQLAPPTPLQVQTLPIDTQTTINLSTSESKQQVPPPQALSSNPVTNPISSSQPLLDHQVENMVFLTPNLNIVRGVTNDIKGQQNILNGQNNVIKGHLNTAQGHQNQIMGLGNDIIASRAMVKGNQNVIIEDLGGVQLF